MERHCMVHSPGGVGGSFNMIVNRRRVMGGSEPVNYLMTTATNPEVLAICYSKGWCASPNGMTYEEAAAVTDIGTTFKGNTAITHFEELEYFGVTSFSAEAFRNCSNLESVVLGANVTTIGNIMFMNSKLKRIVINSTNITNWGDANVFRSCPLEYLYSNSQTTTPAFSSLNMQSLTTLVLSSNVRTVGGFKCPLLTDITIPEGVTTIANYGFRECTSLTTITFPSTITEIHMDTLRNCASLQSATFLSTTPPSGAVYNYTFLNSSCPIYVPNSSVDTYKAASGWSGYASRIQAISS